MSLLTIRDSNGRPQCERHYMVPEATGRSLVHEAATLLALLQHAIGDDSLPKVTRDLFLARALAQAEAHTHRMVIHFDDTPLSLQAGRAQEPPCI